MRFSDEYKREMRALEPDEQSLARMKAAVMKAVSEQEKPKNALPLTKRIAVFGGSAAACALIAVCAVKLAPILTKTDSIISNETQSFASCADVTTPALAADSFDDSEAACDVGKGGGLTFAEDCAASEEPEDYPSFDAPIFSLTEKGSVESGKTDELPPAPDNSADANDFDGGEIYGQTADVRLLDFIRPEKKFDNLTELKNAINDNAVTAKEIFDSSRIAQFE